MLNKLLRKEKWKKPQAEILSGSPSVQCAKWININKRKKNNQLLDK